MVTTREPRFWIGTSWKMNKTRAEAAAFAETLRNQPRPREMPLVRFVIPPFTAIAGVKAILDGTDMRVGAQNMHWDDAGAWTGEISPPMVRDCGADMVELGHSERRAHFGETDETVGRKVAAALRHGLTPLICVGETAEQKADGLAESVLERQVKTALAKTAPNTTREILFAYEPVWAIGSGGVPASPDYADNLHVLIKDVAGRHLGEPPPVLYGGSVNLDNCSALATQPNIDGLFIGRAAWDARDYLAIVDQVVAARSR